MKYEHYVDLDYFSHFNNMRKRGYLKVPIYQEVKEDGFNLCIVENSSFVRVYTKNQLANDYIQGKTKRYMLNNYSKKFYKYLQSEYHFYFEARYCKLNGYPAKSPVMGYIYDSDSLVGLDVRLPNGQYATYADKIKIFKDSNIQPAILAAVFTVDSVDELEKYILDQRRIAQEKNIEGFVYKTDYSDSFGNPIYFKDRSDVEKLRTRTRKKQSKPKRQVIDTRPELPKPEIKGVIAKIFAEIDEDEFRDPKTFMPIFLPRVHKEAEKHGCRLPKQLFSYYQQFLEDI